MPPKVLEVNALDDYKLHLTFDNGEERIFDMKPNLFGVFVRLEDPEYFKRASVKWGSIAWPHNQDLHFGMLYKNSKSLSIHH